MLVLTRKLHEAIVIGDEIRITVVDIHKGKIRLGIEAPHDVAIIRSELLDTAALTRTDQPARAAPRTIAATNPHHTD